MAKPAVLVTRRFPQAGLARIESECDVTLWDEPLPPSADKLRELIEGKEGVVSMLSDPLDGPMMDAAGPQLKVISQYAVGYNNIDIGEASKRNVKVGNTPGALTDATADLAVTLLLAAARCAGSARDQAIRGEWKTWEPMGHIGVDLVGQTIGIVGLGRIGQAVARRCHGGWGMNVLYTARSPKPEAEAELDAKRVDFDALLDQSDFISVHTDLNPSTNKMFGDKEFHRMKPTSIFINTARGGLHDEPALIKALKEGSIFAAGLDVTDPEPPDPNSELLKLPNAFVLPHIGSATTNTRNAMAEIVADNLLAGLQGKPLRHEVTL